MLAGETPGEGVSGGGRVGKVQKGPRGAIQGSHGAAWFRPTPPVRPLWPAHRLQSFASRRMKRKVWLSGGHTQGPSLSHLNSHSTSTTGALGYGNPTSGALQPPYLAPNPSPALTGPLRALVDWDEFAVASRSPFSIVPGAWTVCGGLEQVEVPHGPLPRTLPHVRPFPFHAQCNRVKKLSPGGWEPQKSFKHGNVTKT